MLISLVVPCYNEEESLPLFYKEAARVAGEMKVSHGADFEFIFVDDGSKDDTLAVARRLHEDDARVRYVSFSRNFGKEAGIYAGLKAAKGDYVAMLDADLQDPPSLLPAMLDTLLSGEYDCAATRRTTRKGEPPIRSFFARMGFRTKWFEYENVERVAGQTKWNFWKLFLYSIEGIVGFSTAPLAIAALVGVLFCLVAFIGILFILVRYALGWQDPVGGWQSMTCIILLCSGVQLFCTGILGEYLAKTYLEVKHRPLYVVKETEENQSIR